MKFFRRSRNRPVLVERPRFTSVVAYLQAQVPVFIPTFNNPTYSARMIAQLRHVGFRHIVLVDGGSTYPPMQTLLTTTTDDISVVSLPENLGPRHVFQDAATLALLPRYFCVTDPDLVFNPRMPSDFLGHLALLTTRERVGKAGLALDLSNRAAMRDAKFAHGAQYLKIWEWEAQFWEHEIEPLPTGDPVYRASIDTTFALYDKNYFDPIQYLAAVRVAGRFSCRHLPWYYDRELPKSEELFYTDTAKHSSYLMKN